MVGSIGIPELIVIGVIASVYMVPVLVVVWVVVTLQRIRKRQDEFQVKLDEIARRMPS